MLANLLEIITKMKLIDWVLVLFLLISMDYGFRKGFFKTLIRFSSSIIALLGAKYLAAYLTSLLAKNQELLQKLMTPFVGKLPSDNAGWQTLVDNPLLRLVLGNGSVEQLVQSLKTNLANILIFAIAFILLQLLLIFASNALEAAFKVLKLGFVSQLAGMALAFLTCLLLIVILLAIFAPFAAVNPTGISAKLLNGTQMLHYYQLWVPKLGQLIGILP
ncbi:MAG: CvpA family protein [Clostridia bacterium]